jgi:carboxylesterase type B
MEGTLFAAGSFSNVLTTTSSDYMNYLNTTFGAALVSTISAQYPISMFSSTVAPVAYAIAAVITDAEYACPTRRALRTSLTTQLGTYTYLWNHVPSCPWVLGMTKSVLPFLGATHTSELAFVFAETSNLPQPSGTCTLSASEQILSAEIVTAWQSMAQNGYPAFANGSQWLDWSQGGQGVMFNASLTFATINRTQCDFWDAIQTVTSTVATTAVTGTTLTTTSSTAVTGTTLTTTSSTAVTGTTLTTTSSTAVTGTTLTTTSSTAATTTSAAVSYDGSTVGFILATFFVLLHM